MTPRSLTGVLALVGLLFQACGTQSSESKQPPPEDPPAPGEVRIDPREASVESGDHLTFRATIGGTTDQRVTWKVMEPGGGSMNAAGTYTAPSNPGTFHVVATSIADPRNSGTATVFVSDGAPSDVSILPADRRTTWNPGIPGGIPRDRQTFTTLSGLAGDGTGDGSAVIQQAIQDAGAAYESSGVIQEIVLPAGTFRFTSTIALNRSGVVLRGQGSETRLRYDGDENAPAFAVGRELWGDYSGRRGPWALTADGAKGSKQITIAASDAEDIQPGDILGIDEEDDLSFVRLGDGWYGKRQAEPDTHGPALRGADLHRSVGTMVLVTGKSVAGGDAIITLADPLHMGFRTSNHAQIFHIATPREGFDDIQFSGLEAFYLTGGTISTNNVSYCWIDGLEVDGNPGTQNIGTYDRPGGISGHSIELFHAYRCEVRGSYIHHSRHIGQGGGSYLVALGGYTSESLIEDNIIVFGNKPVVGNMMGGGNVIAYNYVDNARTDSATWQEGAIDLNHLSFSHNALVEGNWTSNMGADTTHGNSGWHVFHRNYATGQNSAPIYGSYPYMSGAPDSTFRRAVGVDGYTRETTFIGNVLQAGDGGGVYQIDHSAGPRIDEAAVWRIGGGVDGGGDNLDDGTTLSLLYRHGNWDSVTNGVVWDPANAQRQLPDSLYLTSKPAFFGSNPWPWVNPLGTTASERVGTLPAKARYDAINAR